MEGEQGHMAQGTAGQEADARPGDVGLAVVLGEPTTAALSSAAPPESGKDEGQPPQQQQQPLESPAPSSQVPRTEGGHEDALIATARAEIELLQSRAAEDRAAWQAVLDERNRTIDQLRVRNKRYEFCLKEAILFLSKPLLTYDEWLQEARTGPSGTGQGASSDDRPLAGFAEALGLVNPAYLALSLQPTGSLPPEDAHATSKPVGVDSPALSKRTDGRKPPLAPTVTSGKPTGRASILHLSSTNSPSSLETGASFVPRTTNTIPSPATSSSRPLLDPGALALKQKQQATDVFGPLHPPRTASMLEVQSMECMRLAHTYLKSTQKAITAMDASDAALPPDAGRLLAPLRQVTTEDEAKFLQSIAQDPSISSSTTASGATTNGVVAGEVHASRDKLHALSAETLEHQLPSFPSIGAPTSMIMSPASGKHHARSKSDFVGSRPAMESLRGSRLGPTYQSGSLSERPEEEDGDIGSMIATATLGNNMVRRPSSAMGGCSNCRANLIRMDHAQDQIRSLEASLQQLNEALAREQAASARIKLSKDILEQELEELTGQLFETANQMVIEESIQKDRLGETVRELQEERKRLTRKLEEHEAQLRAQRALASGQSGRGGAPRPLGTVDARFPTSSVPNLLPLSPSKGNLYYAGLRSGFAVDGVLFSEFQEFFKTLALSSSLPPIQVLAAAQGTVFLRRCMLEDVEPCLFYTYAHPALGALSCKPGGAISAALRKRLLEGLHRNAVTVAGSGPSSMPHSSTPTSLPPIQSTPPLHKSHVSHAEVGSPTSNAPAAMGTGTTTGTGTSPLRQRQRCTLCFYTRQCEHRLVLDKFSAGGGVPLADSAPGSRMRTPSTSLSAADGGPVCPFCRDRLSCVIDFFTFLHYMRQGLIGPGKQGATILGIFRHILWLRRKMGQARVGCGSLFEQESFRALEERPEEWEQEVRILGAYS